jgi:DNA-binding MarR family transcriptional regulator
MVVCGVTSRNQIRRRYRRSSRGWDVIEDQRDTKGLDGRVLMEMLYRYEGMNQREIGEWMGIDHSAVSVMRKRLSEHLERDRSLSGAITKAKKRLQSSRE